MPEAIGGNTQHWQSDLEVGGALANCTTIPVMKAG